MEELTRGGLAIFQAQGSQTGLKGWNWLGECLGCNGMTPSGEFKGLKGILTIRLAPYNFWTTSGHGWLINYKFDFHGQYLWNFCSDKFILEEHLNQIIFPVLFYLVTKIMTDKNFVASFFHIFQKGLSKSTSSNLKYWYLTFERYYKILTTEVSTWEMWKWGWVKIFLSVNPNMFKFEFLEKFYQPCWSDNNYIKISIAGINLIRLTFLCNESQLGCRCRLPSFEIVIAIFIFKRQGGFENHLLAPA